MSVLYVMLVYLVTCLLMGNKLKKKQEILIFLRFNVSSYFSIFVLIGLVPNSHAFPLP